MGRRSLNPEKKIRSRDDATL